MAKEYNLEPNTISSIYSRTCGSFNKIKGDLFEVDFAADLEKSKLFGKVIRDGKSGHPDIVSYDDVGMRLHAFSIKCLEFKNNSIKILKKELEPEIKFCKDKFFEYSRHDIFMLVIVLNNRTNELYVIPYNYKKGNDVIIN